MRERLTIGVSILSPVPDEVDRLLWEAAGALGGNYNQGAAANWPARLVGAVTLRVHPTPERPLSPCVISTVLHRPEAITVVDQFVR